MLKDIQTTEDYNEYQSRFASFMEAEGIENLSTLPECEEHYFSRSPCECCKRPLGGDRYDCNGYNRQTNEVCGPYSVCVDCVYFAEYGKLDDMTMERLNPR